MSAAGSDADLERGRDLREQRLEAVFLLGVIRPAVDWDRAPVPGRFTRCPRGRGTRTAWSDALLRDVGTETTADQAETRWARALGVGVLSGGYWRDELERAGADRVDEDAGDLLRHPDEVGPRWVPGSGA